MNAFSIISLIEPLRYHGMRAAETGHALHVLKTGLYFVRPFSSLPCGPRSAEGHARETPPLPRKFRELLLGVLQGARY